MGVAGRASLKPLFVSLWALGLVIGFGADVRGAEECSAAIDPATGCGVMKVGGPVALVASIAVFVAWTRQTAKPADRRRGAPLILWAGAVLLAIVPFVWLRLADVT